MTVHRPFIRATASFHRLAKLPLKGPCHKGAMKSDAGFTLLELLITLLIGGIVLGLGVPSMVDLVRNNRISAQANALLSSLAMARMEAIKRGVPVIACRSNTEAGNPNCGSGSGWESGWAVFADANRNGAFDAGEPVLLVQGPIGGNNELRGNNNVANRVIFNPQGVVGAGGIGAFTLTDSRGGVHGTRLICMAQTGRTRVFSDGTTACPGGAG